MYKENYQVTSYRDYVNGWNGPKENVTLDDEDIYSLTKNQAQFCNDAEDCGLTIDWTYSGRGMYGRYCPAVRCDAPNDIATKARVQVDSMGRGVVVYAQR